MNKCAAWIDIADNKWRNIFALSVCISFDIWSDQKATNAFSEV
jgi:hypothetical protein